MIHGKGVGDGVTPSGDGEELTHFETKQFMFASQEKIKILTNITNNKYLLKFEY